MYCCVYLPLVYTAGFICQDTLRRCYLKQFHSNQTSDLNLTSCQDQTSRQKHLDVSSRYQYLKTYLPTEWLCPTSEISCCTLNWKAWTGGVQKHCSPSYSCVFYLALVAAERILGNSYITRASGDAQLDCLEFPAASCHFGGCFINHATSLIPGLFYITYTSRCEDISALDSVWSTHRLTE